MAFDDDSSPPINPTVGRRTVAIVATTKNRKNELANMIDSALRCEGVCEVFVIDDGSTDGTAEMVRQRYPQVTLNIHLSRR